MPFQVVGTASDLDGDEVSLQYFKDKHLLSTRSSFPLRGFQLIQDDLLKEISLHIHPHQITFPSLLNVHAGPAALMLSTEEFIRHGIFSQLENTSKPSIMIITETDLHLMKRLGSSCCLGNVSQWHKTSGRKSKESA